MGKLHNLANYSDKAECLISAALEHLTLPRVWVACCVAWSGSACGMIDPFGLQVGESHTSAAVQVRDVLKALGCSGHH